MTKKQKQNPRDLHVNKVFLVLQQMEVSDHKRLTKYLHSPLFNHSRTLTRLYELLSGLAESGNPGFSRSWVWQKMFPGVVYDDVNFRKYCSDLLKVLEAFMAQEILTGDEQKMAIATYDFVVRRKLEPLFNSALRQARITLENQSYRTKEYYFNAYALERQYYIRMDFDVRVDARANLEEISNNLDLFYWIEKLKLWSAVLSQRKTSSHQYQLKFVDEIAAFLENYRIEEVPELAIHYYTFLTLYDENNLDHYFKLRRMLDQYGTEMPQEEAIEMFDSALHYCTGKLNQGNRDFLQEYFDLFETAIEKSIFIVKGELAPWRLNNIIGVALRLGKLEWAETFIEKYKGHLPAETRRNTHAFNLARVYRYLGKFDKVLKLLHNLEYPDIGYNLIAKTMLLITYYELAELDALNSFLESFRVFLNRNKKVPYRIHHLNLIKFARKLIRLTPGDQVAAEKLRKEITEDKANTVNHEWLLEKLAALK